MFGWIKRYLVPEPETIKLLVPGPVMTYAERLGDTISLHISGTAHVEGDEKATANFTITINDTHSLRDLCGMVTSRHDEFTDEPANIYDDVQATLGRHHAKTWIHEPNLHFDGKTPHEIIRAGESHRVRQILRYARDGNS
jgi:hypothetical protein